MKKIGACFFLIIFAAFTLPADESDVIVRAQADAAEDGKNYHALWWGIGGVAITALPVVMAAFSMGALSYDARIAVAAAAPVIGGTSLALIGYFSGKAEVPAARIAEIQDEISDANLVSLYESEYEKTLTKIRRSRQGTSALVGFGGTVVVIALGFLVANMAD
jgi:hypothetical protein